MAIYVSNKHMYVQFIDDTTARTVATTSTLTTEGVKGCNVESAKLVGVEAAKQASARGVTRVVVDRGGFRFHGRVKQIVESAVGAGLSISNDAVTAEEAK